MLDGMKIARLGWSLLASYFRSDFCESNFICISSCVSGSYHGLLPLFLISQLFILAFFGVKTFVRAVRNVLAFCSLCGVCDVVVFGGGLCVWGRGGGGDEGLKGFWKTMICILKIFERFVLLNFACLSLN